MAVSRLFSRCGALLAAEGGAVSGKLLPTGLHTAPVSFAAQLAKPRCSQVVSPRSRFGRVAAAVVLTRATSASFAAAKLSPQVDALEGALVLAAKQTEFVTFSLAASPAVSSPAVATLERVCCVGDIGAPRAARFAAGALIAETSVLAAARKTAAKQIFDRKGRPVAALRRT